MERFVEEFTKQTILCATVVKKVDDAIIFDEILEVFPVVQKSPEVTWQPLVYQ